MAPSSPRPWLRHILSLFFAAAVVVGCGFDLAGIGDAPLGSGPNLQPGVGPRAELFVVSPTQVTLSEKTLAPATFTVHLARAPGASVTLPMVAAPQGRINVQPSSLTFTPENYGADQTVTLTTTQNSEVDQNTFSIDTGPASSSDALFDGADPPNVQVAFEDANNAIEVQPRLNPQGKPFSVSEKRTTTKFYVSLNAVPTDRVTVHLVVSMPGEIELGLANPDGSDPATFADRLDIEFPGGVAVGTARTVVARGKNDDVADGNQDVAIQFPAADSTDPRFAGKTTDPLTITNVDDDTPNLLVSKTSVVISEPNTSDTFTVALATQPTSNVTVTIENTNPDKSTVTSPLTFTTTSWGTPQTVTVMAKDNQIVDGTVGYVLHLKPTSQDPAYGTNAKFTPPDVTVTNDDDDQPAIVVAPTTVTTNESGTSQNVQVHLKYQPLGNVVVTASSNRTSEATVGPSSLTFTPSNWNVDQAFTVTGVNDNPPVADGTQQAAITIAVDQGGGTIDSYKTAPSVVVTDNNGDNDVASVTTSPATLVINENGSGAFNVHLNTQPASVVPVTVRLTPLPGSTGAVVSGSVDLTFTQGDWATDKQATFNVGHDCYAGDIAVPVQVSIVLPSDPAYALINPADVSISVNDTDPAAAVTVTPTTLNTTHNGPTASFDVQLTTRPRSDVKIPVASDDASKGTIDKSTLTFAASDTTCPPPAQTVTLTPKTSAGATGTYHVIVSKDSNQLDPVYKNIDPPDVTVIQN